MAFNQYHEPANELPEETRTFARIAISLIEEIEAIDWYEQRMVVEKDESAKGILRYAQKEEMIHFGLHLEFLLRQMPLWRVAMKEIMFQAGDLTKLAKKAEKAQEEAEKS